MGGAETKRKNREDSTNKKILIKKKKTFLSSTGYQLPMVPTSDQRALFKNIYLFRSSRRGVVAQWLTNPTRNHEVAGSVPGLAQWVKDPALP